MKRSGGRRLNWLAGIGGVFGALGLLQMVDGYDTGDALFVAGVLLVCTSLIRDAIEKSRP